MALKDGNFPAVEEKSHMVLRLADGWQPPGWPKAEMWVWGGEGWDFPAAFSVLRFDEKIEVEAKQGKQGKEHASKQASNQQKQEGTHR